MLCLLFFFVLEVALRAAGFHYSRQVSYMRFNFPNPNELHNIFEPDPELLWRMRPGYDFGGGFPPLNDQGFRGRDFSGDVKKDAIKIMCLGDSVTFGRPEVAYPRMLEKELEKRLRKEVAAYNFGVSGYSSWQGLKLMSRYLQEVKPDVVIILFGWNDHWLAMGYPDSEQTTEGKPPTDAGPIKDLRAYQLINKVAAKAQARLAERPLVLRVPPEDYRANLASMIKMARDSGASVVLATSPSAIKLGVVPDYLTYLNFIREEDDLEKLHSRYNNIVREAAEKHDVPLADLDLIFKKRDVTSLFERPDKDLIHPNTRGYEIITGEMAEVVAANLKGKGTSD